MEIKINRDQKIWISIGLISYTLVFGILMTASYGKRFNYGGYILILVFALTLISFFMYSITRYMTTNEAIFIMKNKIIHNKMKKEQKIWLLIFIIAFISVSDILMRSTHGIRYTNDIYFLISGVVIAFISFVMSCMTQYIQTKEILSILAEKVKEI